MTAKPPTLPLTALRVWDDRTPASPGALNMAVDEALLAEAARIGSAVLRVYRWDQPTLSYGYFLREVEALAARRPDEEMVRRWTGGGIVHHEGAVTWSLAVPLQELFCQLRPAESYARLHESLAHCLTNAGLEEVHVVPATEPAPAGGLCAEAPAPGDLLRQGRKIAGAGQRRTRQGLLHQGIIFLPETELPIDFPQRLASALAGKISDFSPPKNWIFPTTRYAAPTWNARR